MPHANENTMPAARAPKLLDQLRDAIRTKHYSLRTEQAYVQWVRRYIHFHGLRHPSELGKEHVEAFLTSLAVERHVSASTQTQALSALLFLYKEIPASRPALADRCHTGPKTCPAANGADPR
jgi:site-specific recombinase XerD